MQKNKILILVILFLGLTFTAFQCSSTEIESAKLYIKQEQYDKAIEVLKQDVQKNPKSAEGYYLLGMVYYETNEHQQMADAFESSLSISDEYKEQIEAYKQSAWINLFNSGVQLFQQGTNTQNEDSSKVYLNRSIDSFQKAIMIEPDSVDTYKNLAFVYISNNELDKAIEPLQIIIDKEKELDGYRYLGSIYYDKGQRLMQNYETSDNPQDSIQAMEFYNKTIDLLNEARQVYPEDTEILLTLSNAYIAAQRIDEALGAFKAGIEQEPDNQYYHYNYGVLLLNSNNFEAAEEQFNQALEIDPDYQNAIYNLAVTYVRWGATIAKEEEEKETTSERPREKYRQALPHLERMVEMKPDDPAIWELLGRVYTLLNMNNEATEAFSKADELRN